MFRTFGRLHAPCMNLSSFGSGPAAQQPDSENKPSLGARAEAQVQREHLAVFRHRATAHKVLGQMAGIVEKVQRQLKRAIAAAATKTARVGRQRSSIGPCIGYEFNRVDVTTVSPDGNPETGPSTRCATVNRP